MVILLSFFHFFYCATVVTLYQNNYFDFGKTPPTKRQFFLQKTKFSNVLYDNCILFIVIILPALLKSLSLGVEVTGIAKYFLVTFDNIGNRVLLVFHHIKGYSSG